MSESKKFSDTKIAYFSMEIGMDSKVPTYSGGLGVLAGDTLRSCADFGLPIVGVSLIYKKGYFKQVIDHQGRQIEEDESWNPRDLLRKLPNTVTIMIEDRKVKIGGWIYELEGVKGASLPIIFLDTDLEENSEYDRLLTSHLYGDGPSYRLAQEMILGIGGVRMLDDLGCRIERYHMNEGHSALLTLELLNRFTRDAVKKVRDQCVFTTHTPVPAGHDQFDKELAESFLGNHMPRHTEIFIDGKLNMTYLALKFSKFVNGVAKKHGEISRNMFPEYDIKSITNGVHSRFWTSKPFKKVFDQYIPSWQEDPFSLRYVLTVPPKEIWAAHMKSKGELIKFVNDKYKVNMNKNTFTIGFARRAATYKRGMMLFSDIERLKKIAEKSKGIQIIYAGKAHPKDEGGKEIIQQIIQEMNSIKDKISCCYIEDYDIDIGRMLTSGVDVWLNTPMKPQEASGTSGMKAAHNGVPHLSVLDGWWIEGHIEGVTGWSIESESGPDHDAEDLYNKLERNIIPKFYDKQNEWIHMMKQTIALNGSFFNSHRMVQQYVLNAYFK